MSTRTCPTCHRPTDTDSEGLVQATIATRPDAGPAQARHIGNLERQLAEAREKEDARWNLLFTHHQRERACPDSTDACWGCSLREAQAEVQRLNESFMAVRRNYSEAQQFREKVQKASDQYGYSHSNEFMDAVFAILGEKGA